MTTFAPDQVSFGDRVGMGVWDNSHAREHLQFVQTFAAQSPAILMPDYDLLSFLSAPKQARVSMLNSHAEMHNLIRAQLGITGIDLASVDLDNEQSFYDWAGKHATEHAQIRSALGLT